MDIECDCCGESWAADFICEKHSCAEIDICLNCCKCAVLFEPREETLIDHMRELGRFISKVIK